MTTTIQFPPRLLSSPKAAQYLSISETTLRGLGFRRRLLGGKKLHDRHDLDAYADSLRYEEEKRRYEEEKSGCQGENSADQNGKWGRTG